MSGATIDLGEWIAAWRREAEIHCPHCDTLYVDEDYQCVTMCGERDGGDPVVECGKCERDFVVIESVRRTYETRKEADGDT